MELINDRTERKLTYKYENEVQKSMHMYKMQKDGWVVTTGGFIERFNEDKLKVTYVKSSNNMFPMARL